MMANICGFATESRIYEHRRKKDMEVDNVDLPRPNEYLDAEWVEYIDAMSQDWKDISSWGRTATARAARPARARRARTAKTATIQGAIGRK